MAKAKVSAPVPKSGKRVQVVDHKAKVPFWKPKAINEMIRGKLRAVTTIDNRLNLRIITESGPISVGVNFALADVTWEDHIGKTVELVFTGEVGKRHGRTYDAFVIEDEEEAY